MLKAANLTAICEPMANTMWDTSERVSMARYGDSSSLPHLSFWSLMFLYFFVFWNDHSLFILATDLY
jgi:hypothetical protein